MRKKRIFKLYIHLLTTRVRDKEHHKKVESASLKKVADSFGNITDI